jgi:hypothetical protein
VPRLHRALLTAAVLPLTLAACGGGDDSPGGSDRSSQSPKEVVRSVSDELAKVGSYHLDGTQTDEDGASRVSGDVKSDGSASLKLTNGGKQAEVIKTGGQAYIRANAAFWTAQGGPSGAKVAKLLAGRWVKAPSNGLGIEQLTPKNLAYCVGRDVGTLVEGGTREFEGTQVRVIRDKGGPGDAPGELYVAATGRALPVRVTQTGPKPGGGTPDPRCDSAGSTTTASDVRLTRFDEPVEIKAPANALDPAQLAGAAGQSS